MSDRTNGAYPWTPDQGDGTFRNPILYADYSDPDIIRVGEDFYLTASSFNCTPGLPILHSKDLVNWTIIGHALKNLPHPRYAEVQPGCGVWAPAIRFHAGKFWIFFPTPDEGIYLTTAEHPTGPWSEPHLVQAGKGLIDPCPFWDDDGRAYLAHAYAGSRAGIKHILRVRPMAPDGSRLLGEGQIVFHKPERHPTLEGPKFLKKDGWYYILAPAGGVETGWQVVLRSRNIYGPYEDKIVLQQGRTPVNGPHQGALVDTPACVAEASSPADACSGTDRKSEVEIAGTTARRRPGGEWWFAHFQDAGVYGRIMHLQPVVWKDGWPLMGADQDGDGIGEPILHSRKPDCGGRQPACVAEADSVAAGRTTAKADAQAQVSNTSARRRPVQIPQTTDEFNSPRLGLQWQWHANHRDDWFSLSARKNHLRLFAQPVSGTNLGKTANLLLQKFPARTFRVETAVEFAPVQIGEETGLVVTGRATAAIALRRNANGNQIVFRNQEAEKTVVETSNAAVRFCVTVADGGLCQFSFCLKDGNWNEVMEPFQAQSGVWIGAKVGIYAIKPEAAPGGHADYSYFQFSSFQSISKTLPPEHGIYIVSASPGEST